MNLFDIKKFDINIFRDGEFDAFALLDSPVSLPNIVFINDIKYFKQFNTYVSCVICPEHVAINLPDKYGIILSDNPKQLFFMLHNKLQAIPPLGRERFQTTIGNDTSIHRLACIADNNVIIGNNVIIEEFVSIKENTTIGDNVIIRAGSIVGGEGFYFLKKNNNEIMPVHHFGGVIIENNVELQQSCCVDKSYFSWDDTVIGENTKLDNMVHIAHGVKVGKRVFLPSCVSVSGNVIIEDDCYIGPNATISNNIVIGHNSKITLGSVVVNKIKPCSTVTGNFAIDHSLFFKDYRKKLK